MCLKKLRRCKYSPFQQERNSQIGYKTDTWRSICTIEINFEDHFWDYSWWNPHPVARQAGLQQFQGLSKNLLWFQGENSSLLYSVDPKSNTLPGIKEAHEDSSIRRSLHSSIFILTLTAKKTPSKLLNPPWAVPQGSVFAIWWRGLSRHKSSTSTSPDKVSLAGSERT